ncbi:MAG: hypothetical protein ACLFT6_04710 [Bacteroidales bacterium]
MKHETFVVLSTYHSILHLAPGVRCPVSKSNKSTIYPKQKRKSPGSPGQFQTNKPEQKMKARDLYN